MKISFVSLAVLAICAIAAGCGFSERINQKKLADIKASSNTFTFQCPRGESFRLLLGVPEAKVNLNIPNPRIPKPPAFKGQIVIKQSGKQVFAFPISSDNVGRSNWLQTHGLEGGYILHSGKVPHGQDMGAPLDQYLKSGQSYDVTVKFSKGPPKDSSLWLSWISGLI